MSAHNTLENKRLRRTERARRKHQAARRIPFGGVLYPGERLNPWKPGSLEAWLFALRILAQGVSH